MRLPLPLLFLSLLLVPAPLLHADELPAFMKPVAIAERERMETLVEMICRGTLDDKEKEAAINAWIDRQLDLCRKHDDKYLRFEFASHAIGWAVERKRYTAAVELQKYMIEGADPPERRADLVATLGGIYKLMAAEAESPEAADQLRDQARAAFAESAKEAAAFSEESPAALKRRVISMLDEAALLRKSSEPGHAGEAAELYEKARQTLSGESAGGSDDRVMQQALTELSAMGITGYSITQKEAISRAKAHQLEESVRLLKRLLDQTRENDSKDSKAERKFARDVVLAATSFDRARPETLVLQFMKGRSPGIAELVIARKTADRLYAADRYEACAEVCGLVTAADDRLKDYRVVAAMDSGAKSSEDVREIVRLYALSLKKLGRSPEQ